MTQEARRGAGAGSLRHGRVSEARGRKQARRHARALPRTRSRAKEKKRQKMAGGKFRARLVCDYMHSAHQEPAMGASSGSEPLQWTRPLSYQLRQQLGCGRLLAAWGTNCVHCGGAQEAQMIMHPWFSVPANADTRRVPIHAFSPINRQCGIVSSAPQS